VRLRETEPAGRTRLRSGPVYSYLVTKSLILAILLLGSLASAQNPASAGTPLADKTPTQLVECFATPDYCGADDRWPLADLLGTPNNMQFLLSDFGQVKDDARRKGIIYSLYRID